MEELDRWAIAVDALETLTYWGEEVIIEVARREGMRMFESRRLEVMMELAQAACRTSDEVSALIRADLPVGALARWRRLYEFSVLVAVLDRFDDQTAELFRTHEALRRDKETVRAYRISKARGYERDQREVVKAAQSRIDSIAAEHGSSFTAEFAWVHEALLELSSKYARAVDQGRRTHPTLADLAEAVELDMFASEYALASAAVHASTEIHGLGPLARKRGTQTAGHNSSYGISVSCGVLALAPDPADEEMNAAVDIVIAMSHEVANRFNPRAPEST